MADHLRRAREAVESAAAIVDESKSDIHRQLNSIDEGLETLRGDDAPDDDYERGDRLEEIEDKLVDLGNKTEGETETYLQDARDHIDEYRRESAQDW